VRLSRTGLHSHKRPLGSFLFLGPTGTGKTELCKALSEFLFDDEKSMTRIDMSEYMERHSVARLIGAPPGYVGYDQGGFLTEAVRRRPYQVILFDEFEKAHKEVANLLLQVFDEGTLTDSHGRIVDFKNTICIMTSNIGAHILANANTSNLEDLRAPVMDLLKQEVTPEFLNRLDEVIMFNRLSREHMTRIVDIQLHEVEKLLSEQKVTFEYGEGVKEWIADTAYDPIYGAPPLRRVLQQYVLNPLSKKLITEAIRSKETCIITLQGNTIVMKDNHTPKTQNELEKLDPLDED
jgi:ATP-dependent Clp protease ATP-binding subunit ClpB